MLLIGPPGAGKTLLARTIPTLLPDLDDEAALAATVVASVAGAGPVTSLVRRPPVRSPHHTVSVRRDDRRRAANVARARSRWPHEGVLVCDELPEFGRDVLEALRQPLEEGERGRRPGRSGAVVPRTVHVRRGDEPVPVRDERRRGPRLHAARRASRSGTGAGSRGRCGTGSTCGSRSTASRRPCSSDGPAPEPSAVVAARIAAGARAPAGAEPRPARTAGSVAASCGRSAGSGRRGTTRGRSCWPSASACRGRGTERLLRVARTIADLEGADAVTTEHLDEAARFRAPGRVARPRGGRLMLGVGRGGPLGRRGRRDGAGAAAVAAVGRAAARRRRPARRWPAARRGRARRLGRAGGRRGRRPRLVRTAGRARSAAREAVLAAAARTPASTAAPRRARRPTATADRRLSPRRPRRRCVRRRPIRAACSSRCDGRASAVLTLADDGLPVAAPDDRPPATRPVPARRRLGAGPAAVGRHRRHAPTHGARPGDGGPDRRRRRGARGDDRVGARAGHRRRRPRRGRPRRYVRPSP